MSFKCQLLSLNLNQVFNEKVDFSTRIIHAVLWEITEKFAEYEFSVL